MEDKTVIIIGAGPAGLTAAYTLLTETDVHTILLEEDDCFGGISRTAVYKNNRIDIGGHRFFSKSDRVMELWKRLMPIQGAPSRDDMRPGKNKPLEPDGPDPETSDNVMLVRQRVSRIYYLRRFFDYPISLKPRTFINMGFGRTMRAVFGYIRSCIRKKPEDSLEDFYINRFGKPLYEMFFEDYTEKVWGMHPSQISPEWGAQRVKGLSLSRAVREFFAKPLRRDQKKQETSLIERYLYPKKGPGQFWETMAQNIIALGGQIHLNAKATGIDIDGNTVKTVRVLENGEASVYNADAVFSSMPVKDLVEAMGDSVPEAVREIARGLPYRDFITVGLLLKKLKIKIAKSKKTVSNLVPDCWIYIQERDVRLGRFQIFNNWSPYMVNDPENTVWIGLEYFCNEGDDMWNMPASDFASFAIGELVKIDIIDKDDVLDSTLIRVKKAYPAYSGTFCNFDNVRFFLDGIDNLYCIGRNGQHRYNNMDHSMLTAIEAVDVFRKGSRDKSAVWNVNTEEDYHEQ